MEVGIEVEVVNGATGYFIYKMVDGWKYWLTPDLELVRHISGRGYIRNWQKVAKIAGLILNEQIKVR